MKLPGVFVVTLEQCDLCNSGLRIPVLARRMIPEFWGWPDKYVRSNEAKRGLINQRGRDMIIEFRGNKCPSRLFGYATRKDFRLHSKEISSSIKGAGDLLLLMPNPESGDFLAEVLYKDSPGYEHLVKGCSYEESVERSLKHFNYFNADFEPCRPRRRLWTVIFYREEETLYMPFIKKAQADDQAKSIRKSNGEVEVVPFLEGIEF